MKPGGGLIRGPAGEEGLEGGRVLVLVCGSVKGGVKSSGGRSEEVHRRSHNIMTDSLPLAILTLPPLASHTRTHRDFAREKRPPWDPSSACTIASSLAAFRPSPFDSMMQLLP